MKDCYNTIQKLREYLDQSLTSSQDLGIADSNPAAASLTRGADKGSLQIFFKSNKAVVIGLSSNKNPVLRQEPRQILKERPQAVTKSGAHVSSRFAVTPTPNALPPMTFSSGHHLEKLAISKQLRVIVKPPSECTNIGDLNLSVNEELSASPSESIDSGIVSPGADGILNSSPTQTFPPFANCNSKTGNTEPFLRSSSNTIPRAATSPLHFTFFSCSQRSSPLINALALTTHNKGHVLESPQEQKDSFACKSLKHEDLRVTNAGDLLTTSPDRNKSSTEQSVVERCDQQPVIKGILKKPRSYDSQNGINGGNLPRNHMRRAPTRFVLCRSVSESLLEMENFGGVPSFRSSTCSDGRLLSFSEEEELDDCGNIDGGSICFDDNDFFEDRESMGMGAYLASKVNTRSLSDDSGNESSKSTSSREAIDEVDGSLALEQALPPKKRVSFSEHVQARIYRSNSSILGQKKKNEKKARQKIGAATRTRTHSDTEAGYGKGYTD